jgi:hypothetical protein
MDGCQCKFKKSQGVAKRTFQNRSCKADDDYKDRHSIGPGIFIFSVNWNPFVRVLTKDVNPESNRKIDGFGRPFLGYAMPAEV